MDQQKIYLVYQESTDRFDRESPEATVVIAACKTLDGAMKFIQDRVTSFTHGFTEGIDFEFVHYPYVNHDITTDTRINLNILYGKNDECNKSSKCRYDHHCEKCRVFYTPSIIKHIKSILNCEEDDWYIDDNRYCWYVDEIDLI